MDARNTDSRGRGAAARAAIIEAAITTFAAEGYRSSSLNSIARRVGISRQLLLHYFPRKVALLEAVLEEHDARSASSPAPASAPLGSLWEIDLVSPADEHEPDLRRLSNRLTAEATDRNHPAHAWAARRQRRLLTAIESFYAAASERGTLVPDADVPALALLTLGAIEGIERQQLANPGLNRQSAVSGLRELVTAVASADRGAPALRESG